MRRGVRGEFCTGGARCGSCWESCVVLSRSLCAGWWAYGSALALLMGTAAGLSGSSGAPHAGGAGSLMGSATEGLRLHSRKSSPCALKLAQIRRFCACWAKFFAEEPREGRFWASFFAQSGPASVLEATRRTSGWWRWGFCTTRSLLAACRRRVEPPCSAIPPRLVAVSSQFAVVWRPHRRPPR